MELKIYVCDRCKKRIESNGIPLASVDGFIGMTRGKEICSDCRKEFAAIEKRHEEAIDNYWKPVDKK